MYGYKERKLAHAKHTSGAGAPAHADRLDRVLVPVHLGGVHKTAIMKHTTRPNQVTHTTYIYIYIYIYTYMLLIYVYVYIYIYTHAKHNESYPRCP